MKTFIASYLLCLASLSLSSCTTFPATTFTTENVMKVHQGMSSNEIFAMFGGPKNISVRVCGMPPNQWTCTTWDYDVFPDGDAEFTFAGEHTSLILNDFNVDRK